MVGAWFLLRKRARTDWQVSGMAQRPGSFSTRKTGELLLALRIAECWRGERNAHALSGLRPVPKAGRHGCGPDHMGGHVV